MKTIEFWNMSVPINLIKAGSVVQLVGNGVAIDRYDHIVGFSDTTKDNEVLILTKRHEYAKKLIWLDHV
jgi:hypothetical protein